MKAAHKSGFTLIELLVASVLTTILLVAVLGVIRATSRNLQQTESLSPQVASQLRRDVTNATFYRVANNQVSFAGAIAQNKQIVSTQTFAEVRYSIQQFGEPSSARQLLVRDQKTIREERTQPIWVGVARIDFQGDEFGDFDEGVVVPPSLRGQGWKPLPTTCRLILTNDRGEQFPMFMVRG